MKRERLPDTRQSITHKFNINGYEGYIIVGIYPDGRPGELFIRMAKEGSEMRGLLRTIGILASLALQSGIDVEILGGKFRGMGFQPSGGTVNPEQPFATSLIDYIFVWMACRFSESFCKKHKEIQARMKENEEFDAGFVTEEE